MKIFESEQEQREGFGKVSVSLKSEQCKDSLTAYLVTIESLLCLCPFSRMLHLLKEENSIVNCQQEVTKQQTTVSSSQEVNEFATPTAGSQHLGFTGLFFFLILMLRQQ